MGFLFSSKNKKEDMKILESQVAYKEKLLYITNQIHAAKGVDDIFLRIQGDILELFEAERITIYAVDEQYNKLYSKYKVGNEIGLIAVDINKKSIAGYVAFTQKHLNIEDAYNNEELKNIDPELTFNQRYDLQSNYRTREVLADGIMFQGHVQGVVQLINKKGGGKFSLTEISSLKEICKTLGIAFHNQAERQRNLTTKFDTLVQKNIITQDELKESIVKARDKKNNIVSVLINEYKVEKTQILESLSNFYQCPFIEYNPALIIDRALLKGLSPKFLSKHRWTPYKEIEGGIEVLVDDPADFQKIEEIKTYLNNQNVKIIGALVGDIIQFINSLNRLEKKPLRKKKPKLEKKEESDEEDEEDLEETSQPEDNLDDLLSELEEEDIQSQDDDEDITLSEGDSAIIKLANQILRDAYEKGASDIHIEPQAGKDPIIVRFRIDGECKKVFEIPASYKRALASRLKIMAKLDIAERRLPQSGKIKFRVKKKKIELRVEVTPTVGGNEDLVLRILASSKPKPLAEMNFSKYNLKYLQEIISSPYGLVLVVGPTGSGKTTTLHSALGHINKEETKIWTAEDPVEITQKGMRQVQVHSAIGLTFANCMRSFLRADPDVVMVGEMRDKETAAIGIEASLTGHLVFSTLHTNSAAETIVRLLDMGMDAFNFANALLGILAQRLIRTLCPACKEEFHPEKEEYIELMHHYGEELFKKRMRIEYSDKLRLWRSKGCEKCGSGYKGRMGIHELLVGTDEIKRLIIEGADTNVIASKAIQNGMTTLKQDGIMKVFAGYTDLRQIRKVCIK
ncbi:MAG: GspE/PulE family protein [bacterium]